LNSEPQILILKYLQESISPIEKAELLEWVNASEGNKKEFEAYINAWKITESAPEREFSADEAWDELGGKLKGFPPPKVKNENSTIVQHFLKQPWAVGIAATISLVFVFYFAFFFTGSGEHLEVIVAHVGETKEVSLPDGSTVWLNEASKLTYNKSFGSQSRMATLEGEAFFEVARDEEKPFKVSSGGVTTKVLGTSFNIKNERKNNKVEIVVSSGKVAFYSTVNPKKDIILTKGGKYGPQCYFVAKQYIDF
jgi:ferric-dicitrate binding protein FerR (iron transport regulator)